MGYYAYMVSLKEEVESVVIVEKEQSVIDLFEEYIHPQFSEKSKVTIVKADAMDFLRELSDGEYDCCFADILIGVTDIETYMTVKVIGRRFREMRMMYWIEESFGIMLSGFVFLEIMEALSKELGVPIAEYEGPQISEYEMRTKDFIHRLLEKESITKVEHVDYYLNPKNILQLIDRSDLAY